MVWMMSLIPVSLVSALLSSVLMTMFAEYAQEITEVSVPEGLLSASVAHASILQSLLVSEAQFEWEARSSHPNRWAEER